MVIKRTIVVMMTVVLCAAMAAPAGAAGTVPLVWGNPQIARDVLSGQANMLILGDSLQGSRQRNAYMTRWTPESFGGITLSNAFRDTNLFGGNIAFSGGADWVASMTSRNPNDPPAEDGLVAVAPGPSVHWVFDDVTAEPPAHLLANRIVHTTISPWRDDVHFGLPWITEDQGQLTIDTLIYANPDGLASGLTMEAWQSSIYSTPIVSTPVSAYTETPEVRKLSIVLEPGQWDPQIDLNVQLRMAGGVLPAEGSNLVYLGTRFHTSTGLSLTNIAQGGKGVGHFLDPGNCTDANLSGFLNATDTDIAYIWIGQNDGLAYTPEEWQEAVGQLLDRYRAVKPDMRSILISSYDTGSPTRALHAESLFQIAAQRDDSVFLNLYESAGDFEFLNAFYLADGVHQNQAGAEYFADLVWDLMTVAALARDSGDFDFDGDVDADDIDLFCANYGNQMYDLDGDGDCDSDDMTVLIHDLVETSVGVGTEYGDFNLDGTIDTVDLTILGTYFGVGTSWSEGNANCDATIDTVDLTILGTYFGFVAASPIPEPASLTLLGLAGLEALRRRRFRSGANVARGWQRRMSLASNFYLAKEREQQ